MAEHPKVLGGRYQLEAVIGRGGMAEVWRARDVRLGRDVAVKRLRNDLASDPTFQGRFRREAQSAAGLNHPNIVSVYDTGEEKDEGSDTIVPYIVMELVEGHTLKDVLRDDRRILPERALEFSQGVLDALNYSHKNGIIHRDIKPANVMLTPAGLVMVMDFGIARAVADTSATMTQTAAVIGTAQYLSPEQARGETVDNRSDIYSAGTLLYELLTGRPPFIGDSPVSVAYQHVRSVPTPPSELDPEITEAMDSIVLKALEKDPADRYQTAKEMRDDIGRLLDGQPVEASLPTKVLSGDTAPTRALGAAGVSQTAVHPPVANSSAPVGPDTAPSPSQREQRRKTPISTVILITLLIALLGAIGYGIYQLTNAPGIEQVTVPTVIDFTQTQATGLLEDRGLVANVETVKGDADTKGQVIKQDPTPGKTVDKGSTVSITVNEGPDTVKIPDNLVGMNVGDAQKALADAGFTNVKTETATADQDPNGADKDEVLSVSPAGGSDAQPGSEVLLTIASGEATVPNFGSMTVAEAQDSASKNGFRIKVIREESTASLPDTIFKQDPAAGSSAARDTEVTVYVAVAPAPATTAATAPAAPGASAPAASSGGGNPGSATTP